METMLEVGEANLRAGYMTQAAYDAMAPGLRSLLGVLSAQDCESASGTRRDFHRCMSSDYNHVLACGKARPFDHEVDRARPRRHPSRMISNPPAMQGVPLVHRQAR